MQLHKLGTGQRHMPSMAVGSSNKPDVSMFSPRFSPAVLDDVVILTTFGSITDSSYSVVQCSFTAVTRVHDSTTVELEGGGVNSNRLWAIIQCGDKVSFTAILSMVITVAVRPSVTSGDYSNKAIAH